MKSVEIRSSRELAELFDRPMARRILSKTWLRRPNDVPAFREVLPDRRRYGSGQLAAVRRIGIVELQLDIIGTFRRRRRIAVRLIRIHPPSRPEAAGAESEREDRNSLTG